MPRPSWKFASFLPLPALVGSLTPFGPPVLKELSESPSPFPPGLLCSHESGHPSEASSSQSCPHRRPQHPPWSKGATGLRFYRRRTVRPHLEGDPCPPASPLRSSLVADLAPPYHHIAVSGGEVVLPRPRFTSQRVPRKPLVISPLIGLRRYPRHWAVEE